MRPSRERKIDFLSVFRSTTSPWRERISHCAAPWTRNSNQSQRWVDDELGTARESDSTHHQKVFVSEISQPNIPHSLLELRKIFKSRLRRGKKRFQVLSEFHSSCITTHFRDNREFAGRRHCRHHTYRRESSSHRQLTLDVCELRLM